MTATLYSLAVRPHAEEKLAKKLARILSSGKQPQIATDCHGLPQTATNCHQLPQTATRCRTAFATTKPPPTSAGCTSDALALIANATTGINRLLFDCSTRSTNTLSYDGAQATGSGGGFFFVFFAFFFFFFAFSASFSARRAIQYGRSRRARSSCWM